jgi:hypothetical protein
VEEVRKENPVKFPGGAEYFNKEKNLSHQLLKADKRRKSGPSKNCFLSPNSKTDNFIDC